MSVCVPIRDMKSTAEFSALVEREQEVTVTKNGYSAIHCLSDERYRMIQEEVAKSRLLSRMLKAEKEIGAGDFEDYDQFAASLRSEYGL